MPGNKNYRRSCPYCHKRVYVNLYLELIHDTLRKVLRVSKKPLKYEETIWSSLGKW